MTNTTRTNNPASKPARPKLKHQRNRVIRSDRVVSRTRKLVKKNLFDGFQRKVLLTGIEITALIITAVCTIILLLGHAANRFSGTGFFANLLPFTAGILALILISSLFLIGWWKLPKEEQGRFYSHLWIMTEQKMALQTKL